jgi:putative ABC transport system permease protein
MNAIVLIFIVLATMFIASSANNMLTVATALDEYFEMAEVPDYWYATPYKEEADRFSDFVKENGYGLSTVELIQIDPRDILVDGKCFEYSNSVVLSRTYGSKVFDKEEKEIVQVKDGEIYIPAEIFSSEKYNVREGTVIEITFGEEKKSFVLKNSTKDALFGSSMIGMTRFLISDRDFAFFDREGQTKFISLAVYSDDPDYMKKSSDLNFRTIMNMDRGGIKMMYIMDMLIAAVVLVVSLCLILISMVILRFTIHFTLSEEFREIGVMKAIGIPDFKIRGLYIVKYLAISTLGAGVGLGFSIPFGRLLIGSVSKNIILSGENKFYINILCAVATAGIVVLFCYFCTRKIRKFSPIDAVRSGQSGERFHKKSVVRLSQIHLTPVVFMAVNDILSGIKKYSSMVLIFTLGLLLILIPVNTINTLKSDGLMTLFNMADCDLVISQELLFSASGENKEMIDEKLEKVREVFQENKIEAEVFQEIMFRLNISYKGKKSSSLAFLGVGGISADRYTYLEGTPPRGEGEVALSYITADHIGATIGDTVEIDFGEQTRKFMVTAINQSMNNLGEGIRFYEGEKIDFDLAAGSFAIQILYKDNPDKETIQERKDLLKQEYRDTDVFSAGEYISYMIGDVAGQLEGVKSLILGIILCINILVALLMIKSFITKEKGEIAMLKAVGFSNTSLVTWQSLRIGIVLSVSILLGILVCSPLSKLTVQPIFRMMGAYSIEFEIVPLEVYVLYPLTVLFATVLAAVLGATQLRKISAAETSNIE